MEATSDPGTGTTDGRAAAFTPRPIFIHGMFRTGGTYLWSKFRQQKIYRAYYEPLNEILARPEEEVRASNEKTSGKAMRHPVNDFYFAELPFQAGHGAEYFDESFSFDSYILNQNDTHESLRRYFINLLCYSLAHRQIPVLKVDRALLRAGWLTANFKPLNLLVLRKPQDVWASFKSFGENVYFKAVLYVILARNRAHPLLGDLADRLGMAACKATSLDKVFACYWSASKEKGDALYPFFFEFYLLTVLHGARYADCILDLTAISADPELREATVKRLREIGLSLSLDDCHVPSSSDADPAQHEMRKAEETCLKALKGSLPTEFRVPEEKLKSNLGLLGEYFRNILSEFQTSGTAAVRPLETRLTLEMKKQQAIRLIETGHAVEGGALLGEVLQREQLPELWNDWATAQAASRHFASAEAGFRRALELDPQSPAVARNLSVVEQEHQKAQAAWKKISSARWYHRIEVMPGITTPGTFEPDARNFLDIFKLPFDLRGKTAIDVGTGDGAFAFELERRGASATAMDFEGPGNTAFDIAHELLNSRVEYFYGSSGGPVPPEIANRKFDIVLFFGGFNRAKNPAGIFEMIAELMHEGSVLLFEGETLSGLSTGPNLSLFTDSFLQAAESSQIPLALCYAGSYRQSTRRFVPNLVCLRGWLMEAGLVACWMKGWVNKGDENAALRILGAAQKIHRTG